MNLNEAKENLKSFQSKASAYAHATSLIYYDGVTTAPKGTAANRTHTLSILCEEQYKLATSKEVVETLEYLDEHKSELSKEEARMVEILVKDINNMKKIPMDEYVAYQALLSEAEDVWHRAKEASDFAMFEPYLEKIFATNIKFANYIDPSKDPYDYWLNEYEEGLNKKTCDEFFDTIRERIVPLIKQTQDVKGRVDDALRYQNFPEKGQEELAVYLMKSIGLDLEHVGLSTTEHPFTINMGSHLDERITTHYHEDDFASSMYSVIHEGGHALYDTGSKEEYAYTALDGGVSMGIHESQSRFYENILGRSREFCEFVFPKLCEIFPEQMKKYTAEDLYKCVNKVEPSLIRTEADEVTYPLHVMIRYEIEKAVMSGNLKVHDIPEKWNALYKEYLGVDVPDDKHGCLQDSHWSGGNVGYFPSYALGSAYGTQFIEEMKKKVDVANDLKKGDFSNINAWNKENIWQYGSLLKPNEIIKNILGTFNPEYYINYLEAKCKDVYGL